MSLSLIQNILVHRPGLCWGGSVLSRFRDISILPRGISDHAPLALKLSVSMVTGESLWRLSRFWLSDSRVSEPYRSEVIQY